MQYLTRDYYVVCSLNLICNTLLGIIMAGKKWRLWPKSAIFFPVNNFPRHNKNPLTQLFGFLGGMGHGTLHLAFNISNKNS